MYISELTFNQLVNVATLKNWSVFVRVENKTTIRENGKKFYNVSYFINFSKSGKIIFKYEACKLGYEPSKDLLLFTKHIENIKTGKIAYNSTQFRNLENQVREIIHKNFK